MKSKKKKNPNEKSEKFDMGSLANQGIFRKMYLSPKILDAQVIPPKALTNQSPSNF